LTNEILEDSYLSSKLRVRDEFVNILFFGFNTYIFIHYEREREREREREGKRGKKKGKKIIELFTSTG